MKRSTLIEVIAVLFVILLLYTGISKLMEFTLFKEQIAVSPLLAPVAPFIARSLPLFELVLVVLLLVPSWRLNGFYVSTAIMTAFTIYIVAMMLFADQLPCSCGGVLAELSWGQHIVFNSVFIILGIIGIVLEKQLKMKENEVWKAIGRRSSVRYPIEQ